MHRRCCHGCPAGSCHESTHSWRCQCAAQWKAMQMAQRVEECVPGLNVFCLRCNREIVDAQQYPPCVCACGCQGELEMQDEEISQTGRCRRRRNGQRNCHCCQCQDCCIQTDISYDTCLGSVVPCSQTPEAEAETETEQEEEAEAEEPGYVTVTNVFEEEAALTHRTGETEYVLTVRQSVTKFPDDGSKPMVETTKINKRMSVTQFGDISAEATETRQSVTDFNDVTETVQQFTHTFQSDLRHEPKDPESVQRHETKGAKNEQKNEPKDRQGDRGHEPKGQVSSSELRHESKDTKIDGRHESRAAKSDPRHESKAAQRDKKHESKDRQSVRGHEPKGQVSSSELRHESKDAKIDRSNESSDRKHESRKIESKNPQSERKQEEKDLIATGDRRPESKNAHSDQISSGQRSVGPKPSDDQKNLSVKRLESGDRRLQQEDSQASSVPRKKSPGHQSEGQSTGSNRIPSSNREDAKNGRLEDGQKLNKDLENMRSGMRLGRSISASEPISSRQYFESEPSVLVYKETVETVQHLPIESEVVQNADITEQISKFSTLYPSEYQSNVTLEAGSHKSNVPSGGNVTPGFAGKLLRSDVHSYWPGGSTDPDNDSLGGMSVLHIKTVQRSETEERVPDTEGKEKALEVLEVRTDEFRIRPPEPEPVPEPKKIKRPRTDTKNKYPSDDLIRHMVKKGYDCVRCCDYNCCYSCCFRGCCCDSSCYSNSYGCCMSPYCP